MVREVNPKPPCPQLLDGCTIFLEGREILQGVGEAGRMGRGHQEVEGKKVGSFLEKQSR